MATVELRAGRRRREAVLLELARAFHAEDGHPLTERGEAAIGLIARGHPLGRAWLIEEAGQLIGYAVSRAGLRHRVWRAPMPSSTISISCRQARGRGIGRIVLGCSRREARSLGLAALFLVVDPDNRPARRLYDRAGFEGSHWLLMAKRL